MVVTKTDSKRRKRDDDTVQENSKRLVCFYLF